MGSRVCRKEAQNSEITAASAPDSIAVFLRLQFERTDDFCVGRAAAIQHPKGENCPPVCDPVLSLPTPSVRRLKTSPRGKSSITGDVSMAHDAHPTPGSSPARQISLVFGFIADTLEWPHADYQALIVRLEAIGKSAMSLTLADVLAAYTAQQKARSGDVSGARGKH